MAESWTIVDQTERIGELPSGSFGPVLRVSFVTAAGNKGSVDVPVDGLTVERVRVAVDAEAAKRDAIAAL